MLPRNVSYVLTSLIILAFLVAQAIAIIVPVRFYYWPFMDYPMYSPARFEHDIVGDNYALVGITRHGKVQPIPYQELGLTFFSIQ